MTPSALLAELEAAGVRLSLAGNDLRCQTRAGVSIAPHRGTIRQHKAALVTELRLREQIMAALAVEPQDFDRAKYERLTASYAANEWSFACPSP